MEKQFVPYELAVKLKELGFDEKCFMAYFKLLRHEFYDFRSASNVIFNEDNPIKLLNYAGGDFRVKECDAPLWQQAFDWFRKMHNFSGIPQELYDNTYCFTINMLDYTPKNKLGWISERKLFSGFKTYEQARYACLEKLIELVEQQTK